MGPRRKSNPKGASTERHENATESSEELDFPDLLEAITQRAAEQTSSSVKVVDPPKSPELGDRVDMIYETRVFLIISTCLDFLRVRSLIIHHVDTVTALFKGLAVHVLAAGDAADLSKFRSNLMNMLENVRWAVADLDGVVKSIEESIRSRQPSAFPCEVLENVTRFGFTMRDHLDELMPKIRRLTLRMSANRIAEIEQLFHILSHIADLGYCEGSDIREVLVSVDPEAKSKHVKMELVTTGYARFIHVRII